MQQNHNRAVILSEEAIALGLKPLVIKDMPMLKNRNGLLQVLQKQCLQQKSRKYD
jgi:hypothetical protein